MRAAPVPVALSLAAAVAACSAIDDFARFRFEGDGGDLAANDLAANDRAADDGAPCEPESDEAFCAERRASCGRVSAPDNCGVERTVASCGACPPTAPCGGGGAPGVCGCAGDPPGARCSGGMCPVAAGCFVMGCTDPGPDSGCEPHEYPPHAVTVPSFEIDETEVTQSAYRAFISASGRDAPSCAWDPAGRPSHPVVCVSWFDAHAYCGWVGKRLCSEAEWEKAARGTDGRRYPWGSEGPSCERANYRDCRVPTDADPVRSHPAGASPYGAYDMAGNVWEWVQDWYHDSYEGARTDGRAWEEPAGAARVIRGGCFDSYPGRLPVTVRDHDAPEPGYRELGFRCCR